jgi:hypothetical protein
MQGTWQWTFIRSMSVETEKQAMKIKKQISYLFYPREKIRGEALILADHSLYFHLLPQDLHKKYTLIYSTHKIKKNA